jgi:hypothetical protein
MLYMPSRPKQLNNLVPYGCSTLPYRYQGTIKNMGTLNSAIPPAIDPNLNSRFYIAWYSNRTARPKRKFDYTNFENQTEGVMQYSTAHDPTLHSRQERHYQWRGGM